MAKKDKFRKNLSKPRIKSDSDEIGIIGISLALTALSASFIFGDETKLFVKVICVAIYILGGLSTSFLYYTYLTSKIPKTMNLWNSKGGLGIKGSFWIFIYYVRIFLKQMLTTKGNSLAKIRELGYLTVLAILFILWITFGIVIADVLLELVNK
ncbi:hypothetical protein [Flagellimonas allohymeniacidonis]|uniref:Uncharacterized protein n=1 Tax=Flagellimonas allohymeniacidonis TaxID=2517819 RepID=A0A4Q8QG64_9FLAO|nr:hypothetical protein [Allomuricauda hymeniacidonis]TAI48884.1 hypothetical protein EW142_03545 [Allomuricauda hymeniacidonis]